MLHILTIQPLFMFLQLLFLCILQTSSGTIHFIQPNHFVLVVDPSRSEEQPRPLCADSFSEKLGKRICKQLGYRKLQSVSYAQLRQGFAFNVDCESSQCSKYEVDDCSTGVHLHCDNNEHTSFCHEGEVQLNGKCILFGRETVRGYSGAEIFCQRHSLTLYSAADNDEMRIIQKIARKKGYHDHSIWITGAKSHADGWKWASGMPVPYFSRIRRRRHGRCLSVDYQNWHPINCRTRVKALCQVNTDCSDPQQFYYGRWNITGEGEACIPWSKVDPNLLPREAVQQKWLHNYCRYSDVAREEPSCFITPAEEQFCDIPHCNGIRSSDTTWHIGNNNELLVFHHGHWQKVCNGSVHRSDHSKICQLVRENKDNVLPKFVKNVNGMGWKLKCTDETGCMVVSEMKCVDGFAKISCRFPKQQVCGRRNVEAFARDPEEHQFRIIGGYETIPGAHPWTASLRYRRSHFHFCGASVVNSRYLVTAAHCVEIGNASDFEVVTGEWDNSVNEGTEQTFFIERIIVHPAYRDAPENDIALIKVIRDIKFNTYTQPICLPANFTYENGLKCVVSGWGKLGKFSKTKFPERLQAAILPILSSKQCAEFFPDFGSESQSSFCAGYLDGGIDSCNGDSGGPFACYADGSFYLVGLVSRGVECAGRMLPGIYTKTVPYFNWIERVMNGTNV